jgi:hypothetical protein
VPVSRPIHSTLTLDSGVVSIHGESERISVSWMSWKTGRISCGNGMGASSV